MQTERLQTMVFQQGLSMYEIEISGHCEGGFKSMSVLADLPNLGNKHDYHNIYLLLALLLFFFPNQPAKLKQLSGMYNAAPGWAWQGDEGRTSLISKFE